MSTLDPQPDSRPVSQSVSQPVPAEVREARGYLLRVAEPPARALVRFVDEVGPVLAAAWVRAGEVPERVRAETESRRHLDRTEAYFAEAAKVGARLVVPEDDEWPDWQFTGLSAGLSTAGLGTAPNNASAGGATGDGSPENRPDNRYAGQPLALWVRGPARRDEVAGRAVAVIGARAASAYGEQVAAEFGYGLAQAGWAIVSGAAYGIDGCAHRGALAAHGRTLAVLGCGVDICYPAGHELLLRKIAETGAVVSEYPPGTPPARHRFLVRNRLISGFSDGVVVVEAGRRSGARNTAATAAAQGRLVMAVPGPVSSAMSVGCHELLRNGDACLVSSVAEVIETIGRIGADLTDPPPVEKRATDGLDAQSLRVHEALEGGRALSAERIAVVSGLPIGRVRALLPGLERAGLAERRETGWRLSGPGGGAHR